jgi:hypothetical protein
VAATGVYYREMIAHVRKVLADIPRVVPGFNAARGYELAGFVWFQGFNDYVDGGVYPEQDKPGGYGLRPPSRPARLSRFKAVSLRELQLMHSHACTQTRADRLHGKPIAW